MTAQTRWMIYFAIAALLFAGALTLFFTGDDTGQSTATGASSPKAPATATIRTGSTPSRATGQAATLPAENTVKAIKQAPDGTMDRVVSDGQPDAMVPPGYTDREHVKTARKEYACSLALGIRENCEQLQRTEQEHQTCLKLGGYHTFARQCGYQP